MEEGFKRRPSQANQHPLHRGEMPRPIQLILPHHLVQTFRAMDVQKDSDVVQSGVRQIREQIESGLVKPVQVTITPFRPSAPTQGFKRRDGNAPQKGFKRRSK